LNFDGNREILPIVITFGRLGMQHDPAITNIPAFPSPDLLPYEPVVKTQLIIRVGVFVIHMSISIIEAVVLVISNTYNTVLNTESILIVDIEVLIGKFNGPIGQIFTVKKGNPFFLMGGDGYTTGIVPHQQ
jgi:hypothetical protein